MQRFWETVFDTLTGAAIKGAQVWLFHAADSTAAAIWTDAAGTSDAGNPLTSDSNGFVQGYVADGLYNIEFRFAGVTLRTITDVPIFDLGDMRADLDGVLATLPDKLDRAALSALGLSLVGQATAPNMRLLLDTYSKAETDAAIATAVGGVGGTAVWGGITGVLGDQTDLATALGAKLDTGLAALKASNLSDLANVGTSRTNLSVYSKAEVDAIAAARGAWSLRGGPLDNEPPTANFATFDVRNNHPVLDFDTATQEAAVWTRSLPSDYGGAGLVVDIWCAATTAITGTIGWLVSFERMDASTLDIDADSFGATTTVAAVAVPGTSGQFLKMSVNVSNGANMDSLAAGEMFRFKIARDVANDTAAGDAELLYWSIRSQ